MYLDDSKANLASEKANRFNKYFNLFSDAERKQTKAECPEPLITELSTTSREFQLLLLDLNKRKTRGTGRIGNDLLF